MTFTFDEDYLAHYGTKRHSGRYPWGSGGPDNGTLPPVGDDSFLGMVSGMRAQGLSESDIATGLGMTTTQLRAQRSIAIAEKKQQDIAMAQRLKDKGYSNVAIGQRMGVPESSVRALLAPGQKYKADILKSTSDMLQEQVAKKKFVDVGSGVEAQLGISKEKLAAAVKVLTDKGYAVHSVQVDQLGTRDKTTVKVLTPPGTQYKDVAANKSDIQQIEDFSNDGGLTYLGIQKPLNISSSRLAVRYKDQGGADADGVIYVRPGVKDLSLGTSRYAQVRIAVDGSHYIKGMAIYKDDLPKGVDLEFNTNKSNTGNKLDALKPLKTDKDGKIDEDNPFGAAIKRQIIEKDAHGKEVNTSAMNIVNEEGDWEDWKKSIASQVLSKQNRSLAKQQLDQAFTRKRDELDSILALNNPAVKQKLLEGFADDADSAAVQLKAAALPGQGSHVILPVKSMKETEVYAPNYNNGDRVVLIRYPHGGIFEIPELTVNNRQPEAHGIIGDAKDAVGISPKVAERLSGADFDGDTVLVIPNNNRAIKTAPALAGLKGFDPKASYPKYEGMKVMDAPTKAREMGDVSNLITDMTIKGATLTELARAVRHSMVVIDAEKHELNYKQSAIDNGIPALKAKYQGRATGGASTLISRASSPIRIDQQKQQGVNKETGEKIFVPTGRSFVDAKGKTVTTKQEIEKLANTKDAHTLSSGTPIEGIYADHSNKLKALANEARKASVNTKTTPASASARAAYAKEVASLDNQLALALRNSPRERQAQIIGNAILAQKKAAYGSLEPSELKRLKSQALTAARIRTGAQKQRIKPTADEWAAIQAGAISTTKLRRILDNADLDVVKKLATPTQKKELNANDAARARALLKSGHTRAEVAGALGVSVSTLKRALEEG